MRLKQLTLFGFKSFPNRTKVEFTRGICAIVGPNGCGKSNVVDAIRWVLGEQSARMLRARSMDEVIFSGSNGRSVNFAEVSLVLENSSGMAPPEFEHLPEIEIKRLVTRKGDTRYLINGKHCRLKDIHYLLMDTGAGTRAYSIVDQGQVGQFVEMSPQERRRIIEEVAGISRYKARRVEAERRMADTSRNLERLNDLMSEVDRQLKSASRQARKTERYLELRKEQEIHDRALLKYAWNEQKQILERLENEMKSAQEALAGAEAGLSAMRAEKERISAGLVEKDEMLRKLKSGLSRAEELLERFRLAMADTEKQLYRTGISLRSVEENALESRKRAENAATRHEEIIESLEKLRAEEKRLKVEEHEAARYVEAALFHVEHVRQELEEIKVQLVDAAAAQARLDSERRGLKERSKRLELRIEKRKGEKRTVRERLAGLSGEHSSMEARAGELQTVLAELSEKRAQAEQELAGIVEELDGVRGRSRDMESRLAAAVARLEALKAVDAAGEGIPPEVQAILGRESGVMGLLADFIEVERGWERVFETALGPTLHALVVDSTETCARLARSFRENSSGVLNMVVAASADKDGSGEYVELKQVSIFSLPDGVSIAFEPLLSHLRVAQAVAPAVYGILAGTVKVETLDDSVLQFSSSSFSSGSSETSPVMVTSQGETVSPWREVSVYGGSEKKSGLLVRKVMIRDLEEETAQGEEALRAVKMRMEGLQAAECDKRKLVENLAAQADRAGRELSAINSDIEAIRLRIESAGSRIEVMEFEINEAREELLDVEFTLEERETALEECEKRNRELAAALKGREGAVKQQEGVLERRRQKQQELRIHLTRLESSIRERDRERCRLERQQERIRHDSSSFVTEKKRLKALISEQESTLEKITARVDAQESAVSSARARREKLELERDTILQELSVCDERISQQDILVRKAEKKVHGIDVDLSESRQALQFVERSSLERHNISARAIEGVEHILEAMEVEAIRQNLDGLKVKIERMGAVNLGALDEFNELKERWNFLETQKNDLETSMADLRQAIDKINRTCRTRFRDALNAVNQSLDQVFPLLFDGGSAGLRLDSRDDILEAGIEYLVNLPGKKIQHLNLLSGGEKTMAAMALLFAVYFIKPSPFCLLDEVDAPLDEANTVRFNRLIKKIAKASQVVMITHNQRVMDTADTLYGVTMEDRGVSKVVSVNLVSDGV